MVLIPVGLFLIYKALHDSQLFNKDFYYRLWSRIARLRHLPLLRKKAGNL